MATTFQATKVSSGTEQMPGIGDGQSLKCVASSHTVTAGAALVINDVIQSALIQSGSVIVDVTVVVSDLDTATSITLDVGYGVDPDYFVAASTVGQTGGVIRANAVTARPLTLTTNDTVDVLVKAAPGTGATTFTIDIIVYFLPRNA
jgi:hypothetical protein